MRVAWIDKVKAIAIILVVFCHQPLLNNESILGNLIMLIAWGAVPCFFLCSGYIMLNRKLDIKKHIKKIILTYVIVVVWKAVYFALFTCGICGTADTSVGLRNAVNYLFLSGSLDGISTGHFWFMYAYLAVLFIAPVVNALFTETDNKNCVLFLLAVVFLFSQFKMGANFFLDVVCNFLGKEPFSIEKIGTMSPFGSYSNMLFYFILGGCFSKYSSEVDKRFSVRKYLLLFAVGLLLLFAIKYYQTGSIQWKSVYLKNGYSFISTIFLSVGMFGMISKWDRQPALLDRALSALGQNTMGIFYLHILVMYLLRFRGLLFFSGPIGLHIALLKTAFTVVVCAVLALGLKRIPVLNQLVK